MLDASAVWGWAPWVHGHGLNYSCLCPRLPATCSMPAVPVSFPQPPHTCRCLRPWRRLLLANPGAWVLCEGASWSELGAPPSIDFTVAHMYQSMRGSWDETMQAACGFDCAGRW